MDDYQKRVITEQGELGEKLIKLVTFITSKKIFLVSNEEFILLHRQLESMLDYNKILQSRIVVFKESSSY